MDNQDKRMTEMADLLKVYESPEELAREIDHRRQKYVEIINLHNTYRAKCFSHALYLFSIFSILAGMTLPKEWARYSEFILPILFAYHLVGLLRTTSRWNFRKCKEVMDGIENWIRMEGYIGWILSRHYEQALYELSKVPKGKA